MRRQGLRKLWIGCSAQPPDKASGLNTIIIVRIKSQFGWLNLPQNSLIPTAIDCQTTSVHDFRMEGRGVLVFH